MLSLPALAAQLFTELASDITALLPMPRFTLDCHLSHYDL